MNEDAVGKLLLDQFLSLGECQPGELDASGERQENVSTTVDVELAGGLRLIEHDEEDAIAWR